MGQEVLIRSGQKGAQAVSDDEPTPSDDNGFQRAVRNQFIDFRPAGGAHPLGILDGEGMGIGIGSSALALTLQRLLLSCWHLRFSLAWGERMKLYPNEGKKYNPNIIAASGECDWKRRFQRQISRFRQDGKTGNLPSNSAVADWPNYRPIPRPRYRPRYRTDITTASRLHSAFTGLITGLPSRTNNARFFVFGGFPADFQLSHAVEDEKS